MIRRLICRIRGHRLRFAEHCPISAAHALHCDRCGLHGWPGSGLLDTR